MAQPDPDSLDERARRALAAAVKEKAHASGILQGMSRRDVPSASEIHARFAQDTGAPTAAPSAAAQDAGDIPLAAHPDRWSRLATVEPKRGPDGIQHLADREIAEMTPEQRLIEAFERADIDKAVREEILAMFGDVQGLALAVGIFAATFVASQFTPVGWATDLVLSAAVGLSVFFLGTAVVSAVEHLFAFAAARNATTDQQLTDAGEALGKACAEIEVNVLLYLITRKSGGKSGGGAKTPDGPAGGASPHAADADSVVFAERDGQIVVVIVKTIPDPVLRASGRGGWGEPRPVDREIAGPGKGSGIRQDGWGRPGGDKGEVTPKTDRELQPLPKGVFRRGFLNFSFTGTEEAWNAFAKIPDAHAVYVVRDSARRVIYVGITERGWVRWGEHLRDKGGEWLGQASRFEFVAEGYTEKEALAYEHHLIGEHKPPFNSRKNDSYSKRYGVEPGSQDIPHHNWISIFLDLEHR